MINQKMDPRTVALLVLVAAVLVLGLVAYVSRDWLGTFKLSEPQSLFWDIIAKTIGGVVALGAAVAAVWKYLDERTKTNQAALIEARKRREERAKAAQVALIEAQKPFMTKRQDIYFQLVSETAWIGTKDASDPRREEAISQFWWLFWGPLPMVSDKNVAEAADKFSEILDANYEMPPGETDKHKLLRNASMNLAIACRASVGFIPYQ
jgi:hypothetical protein